LILVAALQSSGVLLRFIFTIKNFHNLLGQMFRQKKADSTICDESNDGPVFGRRFDLPSRLRDDRDSRVMRTSQAGALLHVPSCHFRSVCTAIKP
jgi:hypothetical protein